MEARFASERRTVTDAAELEAVLDEAAASPTLVFLAAPTGTLAVGVGHPALSVLLYVAKEKPEPIHALGDPQADGRQTDPPLVFDGRGFFGRCAVLVATARAVAREFLATDGLLANSVAWEPEPVPNGA